MTFPREQANFDEVSMQQNLLSDSLKDLNNLRKQLYSAAEYFELSYNNEDQKQIVGNTLKDYAIKALVSTVDHLGFVTYKVNDLFDKKVDEVTETELRVSCIEQRLRTCQEHIDHEGLSQQSLVINAPKYHKRYIFPDIGDTMEVTNFSKLNYQGFSLDDDDYDWNQYKNDARAPIGESPSAAARKSCSPSPSPQWLQQSRKFSFSGTTAKKELERRTVSPHRFPHLRMASLASQPSTPKSSRPSTPNPSRPTTPNPANGRWYPEKPRKSASMRLHVDNINIRDTAQNPSKGKRLLKALLSGRKSRKDDMLYTYLDEY